MAAARDRKRRMVSELIDLHLDNYKRSGAELIIGSGRFIGPKTLEVTLPDAQARIAGRLPRSKSRPIPTLIALTRPQVQSCNAAHKRCAREGSPYPRLTSPRWAASATASVRPTALSFSKMALTWFFTVCSLM